MSDGLELTDDGSEYLFQGQPVVQQSYAGELLPEPLGQTFTVSSHHGKPQRADNGDSLVDPMGTPVNANIACSGDSELRPAIIDGVCRLGETVNVIGAPKAGKSWFALSMAFHVAAGRVWLNHETLCGNVLIIDNELHSELLIDRLRTIATALEPNDDRRANILSRIDFQAIRGRDIGLGDIEWHLEQQSGKYSLIIMDAFYRLIPTGTSENDNSAMKDVFNQIDRIARKVDAAIVLNHHSTKGNQSEKNVTDVGSGAGSIARAADTHMIIREHELEGCAVLDVVCRSFPPHDTITIQFDYPRWDFRDQIAPSLKAKQGSREARQSQRDEETNGQIIKILTDNRQGLTERQISTLSADDNGKRLGPDRIKKSLERLIEAGKVQSARRRKPRTGKRSRKSKKLFRHYRLRFDQ